jgi:enterobactin synthetase component D
LTARAAPRAEEPLVARLFSGSVSHALGRLAPRPAAARADLYARRQAEYRAGRALGARLLERLGAAQTAIGAAADRAPVWPRFYVGSISHSDSLVFVAVARQSEVAALGIDVEPILSRDALSETAPILFNPRELALIDAAPDAAAAATIVFSAKEALFKCLYPLTRRFFSFEDAEILRIDDRAGRLSIRLLTALSDGFGAGRTFEGRFGIEDGNVFSVFEQAPQPA